MAKKINPPAAELAPAPAELAPAAEPAAAAPAPAAPAAPATPLESLVERLQTIATEAEAIGEAQVAKIVGWAVRSGRRTAKRQANRRKRVGGEVAKLQARGLTPEQIVAELSK